MGHAGNASVSLSAPTGLGTHYYGACVDAVPEETNRSNNCSAAVAVTVREPPAQPDLEVRASLGAGAVRPGAAFELVATVRNRGGAGAPATTLRYYRSADATIARSDIELGTDGVSALRAGGGETESLGLTAPLMSGTYHYGACVDAVQDESDTSNNCSSPVDLDVAEALAPDLEVGTPTVDNSSLVTGELFTLSVAVTNAGDGAAAATTLRYYRSADAAITTSDTEMGTDAVEALAASGTSAESTPLVAPLTAGTYYYGACADAVEGESDITNNCSPSVRVDVAELAAPDLEVGTPTVDNSSLVTGELFTLSVAVTNAGDGAAAATTLRYYRSADAAITTSDTEMGTDAVEALAASGTSAESTPLVALLTAGTYYYGALCGRGGGRVGHNEQLLAVGQGGRGRAGGAGPRGRDADGGRREPRVHGDGGIEHAVGHGHELWRRDGVVGDATLLPLVGRDDHDVGPAGGNGRGGGFGRLRDECTGDRTSGAVDGWLVLLRGLRGCGGRRVGHYKQLFVIGASLCRE